MERPWEEEHAFRPGCALEPSESFVEKKALSGFKVEVLITDSDMDI